MNEDVEQSVPRKRKRKAPVWDNFEVTLISGEDKAICKHCDKILSAKALHGTNSLNTHVKSCKGLQSQSTRSEGSQRTVRMGQFDKTHETNAKTELANMIIMHEYPLSMVEISGSRGDDDMDAYDAFVCGSSKDTDKSDLERYLDETVYPTLYKVARDFLAIPVSTVAFESAFSTGGRIDWLWSELRDAPSTLEDDIDVDEESCHDSDVALTPHQTDDTNTRRGRAARTRSSPFF
ncbi:hypothetical protein ACLB2K_002467 [Fragaria x ananassa]